MACLRALRAKDKDKNRIVKLDAWTHNGLILCHRPMDFGDITRLSSDARRIHCQRIVITLGLGDIIRLSSNARWIHCRGFLSPRIKGRYLI